MIDIVFTVMLFCLTMLAAGMLGGLIRAHHRIDNLEHELQSLVPWAKRGLPRSPPRPEPKPNDYDPSLVHKHFDIKA